VEMVPQNPSDLMLEVRREGAVASRALGALMPLIRRWAQCISVDKSLHA